MIQWVAFKAMMKKAFVWLKTYWYIPAVIVIGVVTAWVVQDKKAMKRAMDVLETATQTYKKEKEVINETHKKEIDGITKIREEKRAKQTELIRKKEEEVKETFDRKHERVKELVEEFGNDSDIVKEMLEREFGFHEID